MLGDKDEVLEGFDNEWVVRVASLYSDKDIMWYRLAISQILNPVDPEKCPHKVPFSKLFKRPSLDPATKKLHCVHYKLVQTILLLFLE